MNEDEQVIWGQPVSFLDFVLGFLPNLKILNPVFTPFFNKTPMQAAMRQIQSPEARAAYWNATHPQTTNETPIVAQPDGTFRRETRNIPLNTSAEAAKTALEFTPVVGDVMFAGDVADEARQGNYGTAAALAGLAVLPNVVEKPLKKGLKKIGLFDNATTATKATPAEWTAAQDAAIARGDIAEAQRLRDLHFKVSAPDTKIITEAGQPAHIYHGTNNVWTVYDPNKFNSATGDHGFYGKGLYGTESRPIAKTYGNKVFNLYVNAKKPFVTDLKSSVDRNSAIYWFNREIPSTSDIPSEVKNYFGELNASDAAINSNSLRKFDEVVIPNGNQIKLANAVTYDDKGVRIPLGERDNFNVNDIRYIWPTAVLGGTAAASYANQQGLGRKQSDNKFYSGGNIIKKFKSRNK